MSPHEVSGEPRPGRRQVLKGGLFVGALASLPAGFAVSQFMAGQTPKGGATKERFYTGNDFGTTDADYRRVGVHRNSVAIWEDGFRTAGINDDPNAWEWWYADFTGEDGTVVSFLLHTRLDDGLVPEPGEARRLPMVTATVTDPDGTTRGGFYNYEWKDFSSSTERCEVRVGPWSMTGDLKTYRMKGEIDEIAFDLTLTSLTKPFRPGNGFLYFGDTDRYLTWLPVVPRGRATGTVTVNGKKRSFTGNGYHDHQWGNYPMPYSVDYWRWGRASVGPYAAVGFDFHLRPEFGSARIPVLLVDNTDTGERPVASISAMTGSAHESNPQPYPEPDYLKDYYATVKWTYADGSDKATFTLTDTKALILARRVAAKPAAAQKKAMDNLGIDQIWYTRYDADASLDMTIDGARHKATGEGLLENLQFGLSSSPPKST
ncbi:lipocalin-like domain-containing protein [Streptomyces cadmiisoli]|uniref:lipocalin-like domain-containing protein n=1 Tax=Streptomyces cadmiisoli TaxID=2184053 RepID=UPI003D720395